MKNIQLFLAILFASCLASLQAQINHTVTVQSNFFAPTSLTITQGDTVTWENLGGFHNVNGSQATYPDNPEGFINGNASGDSWTYSFVFNTPGTYDYQCDPHVGLGMTGQVIVEPIVLGPTDLLISGVFDGPLPGGQPKGIELYVINDIADLSVYGVGSANNGGGSDGNEFSLPAVAATAGDYLYVVDNGDDFEAFFGFAADFVDDTNSSMAINGDDAIELYLGDEVVDIFGDINVDGSGEPWEYLDGWAYRVNGTGPDGTTFVLSNWTFSGINAFDGETSNTTAASPMPVGTYSTTGGDLLIANNDVAETDINTPVVIPILSNDLLPNGFIDISTPTPPANGTLLFNAVNDTYIYTPNMDFCGEDSFVYEVCDINGCQMATVTITVICPVDYVIYTIGDVDDVNEEGVADSLGVYCQLQGIVYGVNLTPAGLQFTLIDGDNNGIGMYNGENDFGYTVTEGDEVIVQGQVDQFNGLLQLDLDTVWTVSSGNSLLDPTIVTALGEETESQLVTIENVSLVDPAEWGDGTSGFNVEVTDGTNTYTVRIDNDVDLFTMPAPEGNFNVTGLGGQFDNAAPFENGYQLLPRYMEDIDLLSSVKDASIANLVDVFPNPATAYLNVQLSERMDFLRITDVAGQEVLRLVQPELNERINLHALSAGTYFVTFIQGDRFWTTTVAVTK
jgi:plastocyanin